MSENNKTVANVTNEVTNTVTNEVTNTVANEVKSVSIEKISKVGLAYKSFEDKVIEVVGQLSSKLPKDLTTLDVVKGNAMESKLMEVYSKMDSKAKELKEERMEFTRIFTSIAKNFTTSENAVANELSKVKAFVENWNAEKLRRERIEQTKLEEEQLKKQRLIQLENDALTHYSMVALNGFTAMKNKVEQVYYGYRTEEELKDFAERTLKFDRDKLKASFAKFRNDRPFQIDGVSDVEITKKLMPKLVEMENEYVLKYIDVISNLHNYTPTRIKEVELLLQDEEKAKAEAEALKETQERARLKAEAEARAKIEAENQEKKIEALTESLDAKPTIELSKGANVKLKYYPKDHAELLRVINWYLHTEYASEDFETLNKRLSFMRTAADKALNAGEVIEGVMHREEVKVRRTSTK